VEVEVVLPVAKLLRGCRSLGGDRKGAQTKADGEKKEDTERCWGASS
jgi:hypothetical protein